MLLIDDMEPLLQALRDGLTQHGFIALTATSGEEGLRKFQENLVDVVICDLGMPGLNGWEVGCRVAKICQEQGRPKIPFLLLTGWAEQMEQGQHELPGYIDRIIRKPLKLGELLQAIRAVVRSTQ